MFANQHQSNMVNMENIKAAKHQRVDSFIGY